MPSYPVNRDSGELCSALWYLSVCVLLASVPQAGHAQGLIERYSLGRRDGQQLELPRQLREVSGLAISRDGRFFAHGDERGVVFEIDPNTGATILEFSIGEETPRDDFEGIAVRGSNLYLVTSQGGIAEFSLAGNGERVPFVAYRGLPNEDCEVEGLEYDSRSDSLLLACKTPFSKAHKSRLVVFAFSLTTKRPEPEPRIAIPLDFLAVADLGDELSPSGIAVHPASGTVFVLASREHLLVELSPDGRFLGARKLSSRVHRQPEGVAFSRDGTLWIVDEGGTGRASLTRYAMSAGSERP